MSEPSGAGSSDDAGVRIRPALLADLAELLRLEQVFDVWQLDRRRFRYLLTQANALLLVAESPSAIPDTAVPLLGYLLLLFRRHSSKARVYSLAVDPAAQRQRLGCRLLTVAEQVAIQRGCTAVQLEVSSANTAAIKLYEHAGYSALEELPDYYGPNLPGVRYLKPMELAHSP